MLQQLVLGYSSDSVSDRSLLSNFSYSTFERCAQANHAYVFSKAKGRVDYHKQNPGEGFLLPRQHQKGILNSTSQEHRMTKKTKKNRKVQLIQTGLEQTHKQNNSNWWLHSFSQESLSSSCRGKTFTYLSVKVIHKRVLYNKQASRYLSISAESEGSHTVYALFFFAQFKGYTSGGFQRLLLVWSS